MVRCLPKCLICEQRPARKGGICAQCYGHIEHERKSRVKVEPRYFVTYRGNVVGFWPNGDGKLKGELLRREAANLPKGKTINLDTYCEGFERSQIKALKACVLKLAHA